MSSAALDETQEIWQLTNTSSFLEFQEEQSRVLRQWTVLADEPVS